MQKIYFLFLFLFSFTSLFSQVEGTWKIAPEAGSLAVGPTEGDFSWWSIPEGDVTIRACLFDDEFVFEADGTFSNVQGGDTWLELWQGAAAEGCGEPIAPHDGSNPATWALDGSTLILTGVGAHLGLTKVTNDGEIDDPANAPASIAYPMVIDGNRMTIDIDFGGGFWHFVLERDGGNSVQEIVTNLFSFYPNPANSVIQINSEEVLDQITISTITGKEVLTKVNPALNETFNVATLPTGLYLLRAQSGNKVMIEKLSIN
ncbi:MAG: hypothetical protein ACJAT4_000809 [Granulosicoccus sp.]|jgi:hypothetical protein